MNIKWLIAITALIIMMSGCENDYSYRGDAHSISFSADTLSFDTIFAGEASVTGRLMIYNKSGENITIDKIWLKGGKISEYNVNINGASDLEVVNLRMRDGDSLYVFVNVLPKESQDIYRISEDEICVKAGNNLWSAKLWACGVTARKVTGEIREDTEWTNDMPYVMKEKLIIDSVATLTIREGVEIYCTEGARLEIEGKLKATGTKDNNIVFRGMRRGSFYHDIPGQWDGIYTTVASGCAELRYTEIANATNAMMIDSATTIVMEGVRIRDTKHTGLVAYDAKVRMTNCLIYNCGREMLKIYGGDTKIAHSTLAGYYRWDTRLESGIWVNGEGNCPEVKLFDLRNSVVVGNQSNELEMGEGLTKDNCLVSHCYIRLGTKWKEDTDERFDMVKAGKDPCFKDKEKEDYHLTEESPLIGEADVDVTKNIRYDYDGTDRLEDEKADIGAFEYITIEEE